jgi:hypothetical protein
VRLLAVVICCVALVTILVGCSHDHESFYAARSDAEKGGEFERGWLPDFLPKSSHAIHLAYDLSPSREWCGFQFDPADAETLMNSVKSVDPHAPPIPQLPSPRVQWWPKFFEGDLNVQTIQRAEQAGFALYSVTRPATQATNETVLFAIDRKNGRGYFYGH